MTSDIRALINIISAQVDTIEAKYAKAGESYPSLDQPEPTFGALDHDPEVDRAKDIATAAAAQLLAGLRSPLDTVYEMTCGTLQTAALGFVEEVNIANILAEAGPQGLHVNEISKACGTDASYIARILRFLATRHVFREVTPDVFVHNRISNAIKKEKTLKEIKENPVKRYEGASIASFISIGGDDLARSASCLSQFIQDPTKAAAPFNIAYNTSTKYWDWLEEPGNEWRLTRLSELMASTSSFYGSELFLEGFDWKSLPKDSICVDVGGRTGSLTKILLEANPHLKFVIQDLPGPIREGQEIWQKENPEVLKSGQVQLQAHDFFTPQPIKNPSVYFMRMILHDWPDYKALEILKALRAAAGAETKLVVFDMLALHTCVDPDATAPAPPAPAPLLANLGSGIMTMGDLVMLAQYDGKERTEAEFKELGQATGWKLEAVKQGTFGTLSFSPA